MILKTFKENLNKKYINKTLSKREVSFAKNKVKSLGVLINIDEVEGFDFFNELAEHIKIRPNKLKVIAFSEDKKETLNTWVSCYGPKDFGWNGSIKNIELKSFLDEEFDALISYYTKEGLELKMITALSKAKFKIGILQTDSRLNDLIINTDINEFDVFKNEVFKYLTILNKI